MARDTRELFAPPANTDGLPPGYDVPLGELLMPASPSSPEAAGLPDPTPPILTDSYYYPEHVEDTLPYPSPYPEGYDPALQVDEPRYTGLPAAATQPVNDNPYADIPVAGGAYNVLMRGSLAARGVTDPVMQPNLYGDPNDIMSALPGAGMVSAIPEIATSATPGILKVGANILGQDVLDPLAAGVGRAVGEAADALTPAVQKLATEEVGGIKLPSKPEEHLPSVFKNDNERIDWEMAIQDLIDTLLPRSERGNEAAHRRLLKLYDAKDAIRDIPYADEYLQQRAAARAARAAEEAGTAGAAVREFAENEVGAAKLPGGKEPWEMTHDAYWDDQYKRAGDLVSGLKVREDVPNVSSISASLDNYDELPGIREVPMSAFYKGREMPKFYSPAEEQRTRDLARQIKESGELNPLIIAVDEEGPYIIEGGHRLDALRLNRVKSFPAVVVKEYDATGAEQHYRAVQRAIAEGKPVPAEVLSEYPDLEKIAPMRIGQELQVMGGRAVVSDVRTLDGTRYELYSVPDGDAAIIRVKDTDADEVVLLKKYPNMASAQSDFDDAIARAQPPVDPPRGPEPPDRPTRAEIEEAAKRGIPLYAKEQGGVARLRAELAETPPPPTIAAPSGDTLTGRLAESIGKERGFARNVRTSSATDKPLRDQLTQEPITYSPIHNADTMAQAESLLATNRNEANALVFGSDDAPDDVTTALGHLLLREAQTAQNWDETIRITEQMARRLTTAGQGIQAASLWSRQTPEGFLRHVQSKVREAQKSNPNVRLTPEQAKRFTERMKAINEMPEGRDRAVAMAVLLRDAQEIIPSTILEKISMGQTIAQLVNPKTMVRNLMGNAIFFGAEQAARVLARAFDVPVSLFTHKSSVTSPDLGAQLQAMRRGLREGYQEAALGINLRDNVGLVQQGLVTQNQRRRVFDPNANLFERLMSKGETGLRVVLQAADRAFYEAAFQDSLLNSARADITNRGLSGVQAAAEEVRLLSEPTKDMLKQAHLDGLFRTFQDSSALAEGMSNIKRGLNLGKGFGLGDLVLKYPRTPANLLLRAIGYSPGGYVHALRYLAEGALLKKPFNQKAFVDTLGRATVGSVGLTFAGAKLAELGLLTGGGTKDPDLRAMHRDTGMSEYAFNVSGFTRYVLSGFDPKQAKRQYGDHIMSYDWALPLSVPLAVGARAQERSRSRELKPGKVRPTAFMDSLAKEVLGDAFGASAEVLATGLDTVAEQPLFTGVKRFFQTQSAGDAIVGALASMPSSFVPTMLSQVNALFDNVTRETYDPDYAKQALNGALAKIPVLAATLPERVNVWGEPLERYQNDTNNPFNVFVNPAFVNQNFPKPEAQMLLDLYQSTGSLTQLPRVAPKSFVIDGTTYVLSAEQYVEYQRLLGEATRTAFQNLRASETFQNADEEERVKFLGRVLTDVNAEAKDRLRAMAQTADGSVTALPPPDVKEAKHDSLSAENAAEYFKDKQLKDEYDLVKQEVDRLYPNATDAYKAARIKDKHDTMRRSNPELDKAGVRWGWWDKRIDTNVGPRPPRPPAPPSPPRIPAGVR